VDDGPKAWKRRKWHFPKFPFFRTLSLAHHSLAVVLCASGKPVSGMITRVAVRADALPRDVTIAIDGAEFVRLRGALIELLPVETVGRVTHAAARGPCFTNVNPEEADSVDFAKRLQAVAVRGGDQVAVVHGEWRAEDVQIELYEDTGWDGWDDDDRTNIGSVEVLAGGSTACVTAEDGTVVEKELSKSVVATLNLVVSSVRLTMAECMQNVEECSDTVRPFGEGESKAFELPVWCGEVVARYLSVKTRLHVLFFAELNTASPRPLCLEHGGVLTRGRRGDMPITRLTFALHKSCAPCMCCAHGGAPCSPLAHRAVKVCFEFCGECCASTGGHGCARHGDAAPASTNSLNARICSAARRMVVLCSHGDHTGFKNKVCADLPCDDPFLATFAAAAVELVDPNSHIPSDRLESAVCQQFDAHVSGAPDRESDDTLLARDQLTTTMILSRNYYFGYSQHQKRNKLLRKMDGSAVADKVFKRAMLTHAHLLPTCTPCTHS
jgi:hypothetical protein